MEQIYDITEVCAKLGTTSRTLRYYEEQGIIESSFPANGSRRSYSESQLNTIKKVMALRTLGLSVKKIKALHDNQITLENAISEHRADMMRLIMEKQLQINLLEEVLHDIQGKQNPNLSKGVSLKCAEEQICIAQKCTDGILKNNFSVLLSHFSEDMKIVLPQAAFRRKWEMMNRGIGSFIHARTPERLPEMPNIIIHPLEYEHMILRLQYVFHDITICGLWMNYAKESNGGLELC